MKMHKTVVVRCLLSALFLGVSSGAVLVIQTVQTYSGACGKLNGFPGLMQKAGFVPEGSCNPRPHAWEDCHKHRCVVDGQKGHCVSERLPQPDPQTHIDFLCVCKPNPVSR